MFGDYCVDQSGEIAFSGRVDMYANALPISKLKLRNCMLISEGTDGKTTCEEV